MYLYNLVTVFVLPVKKRVGSEATLNTLYAPNQSLPIAGNLKITLAILRYYLNVLEIGGRLDWPPLQTSASDEGSTINPELDAINQQVSLVTFWLNLIAC